MYGHFTGAELPGHQLVAILTSETTPEGDSGSVSDGDANAALLALYQHKFRDNVEFYGRILMAQPGVWPGEGADG